MGGERGKERKGREGVRRKETEGLTEYLEKKWRIGEGGARLQRGQGQGTLSMLED